MFKKIFYILETKDIYKFFFLFLFTVVAMILETFGIGIIIPFISIIIDDDFINKYNFLQPILNIFNISSKKQLIVAFIIFIMIFFLIKNFFIIFFIWFQNLLAANLQCKVAEKLFSNYIKLPYEKFLHRNSSELIRNVYETSQSFQNLILSLTTLFSEILITLGILTLLMIYEFVGTSIVFLFFVILMTIYYIVTNRILTSFGERRLSYHEKTNKHLLQGFGSVKEITLLGREKEFINIFNFLYYNFANITRLFGTISALPRIIIEISAVISITFVIILSINNYNGDYTSLIYLLSIYGVASFRLIPSINKLLNSIQTIRYQLPALDIIYNDFNLKNLRNLVDTKVKSNFILNKKSLQFKEVSFAYKNSQKKILNNISFDINIGDRIGIVGESGVGKSTLVDLILGILEPSNGKILLDGKQIKDNLRDWQQSIGYVPQQIYLTDDSIKNNIAFGLKEDEIELKFLEQSIKDSRLKDFVDNLKDGFNTYVGERGARISGGQLQRIGIARALYNDPSILILDEFTSSLDLQTEEEIIDNIFALKKKTIIVISHRESSLKKCNKIFKLEKSFRILKIN